MILVTAWLLVEVASTIGGFVCSSAALAQSVAIMDKSKVVFPVPGGPLTAKISPSLALRK